MSSRTRTLLISLLAVVFLSFLTLAGCGGGDPSPSPDRERSADKGSEETTTSQGGLELYTPKYDPSGDEKAVMKTSKGDIEIQLFGDDAPIHVGNFVELARKDFYSNTKFHRYEPGFVIQGGDPQTREFTSEEVVENVDRQRAGQITTGTPMFGTGNPGYTIKGEFNPEDNPQKHVVGALGMARSQDPDSAGSQFYFALEPLPQLDGSYTVFGVVTKGLDVVKQLRVGDEIISIEIIGAEG